jgi:gamma-glutamyltranspeptidase / glutathione hydrolase
MPCKPTNRRRFLGTNLAVGTTLLAPWPIKGQDLQVEIGSPIFASGSRAAAATVHPLATKAALDCISQGGNAVDAAVAASLMLSVVDGHNSGLGGGGLALIRLADGQILAIDGREVAPKRATIDLYRNAAGMPDPRLSQEGPLAVAVPGLPALLNQLATSYGNLSWQHSLLSAAEVAEAGFEISSHFARVLQGTAERLKGYPSSAEVLLDSAGQPFREGNILRQKDLARSLRKLAELGVDWFYRGEFAEILDRFMQEKGGCMRFDDLDAYRVVQRQPIQSGYRGRAVFGFPPPSSGGIHIAQMLGMLEKFELAQLFEQSPAKGTHLLLEVMKRAMADRAHWLGDSDFVRVPSGLIDASYIQAMAETIDLTKSVQVTSHGIPPSVDSEWFGRGGHTTHLTTADAEGNIVALTQTINTSFGSKMILPGTGVVLNNEMDDFSLAPGVRNAFGLLGSEANQLAAGKRPLSSMSPTIVIDADGSPVFTCGAAGGPRIITSVLQCLVRWLDLHLPLSEVLGRPRVHHQWSPDRAVVENAMPESLVDQLKMMGHDVSLASSLAVAQSIAFLPDQMQLSAASDPRVPSAAGAL